MKQLYSVAVLLLLASCQRLDIATPLTSDFPPVEYSVAQGVYPASQQVVLSVPEPASSWDGTKILWTLDPMVDLSKGYGNTYSEPVTVDSTRTLRARLNFGPKVGPESGAVYVLTGDLPPVTFSPTGGTFYNDVNLTLSTAPEVLAVGGSIKATSDGSIPIAGTPDFPGTLTLPIVLGANTIRAVSSAGGTVGTVNSEIYYFQVAKPVLSPPPGTYAIAQNVVVTTSTLGAVLYYTHGMAPADPTTGDTTIANGSTYSVTASETLKVKGFRALYGDSEVAEGLYTITGGVNLTIDLQIPVAGVTGTMGVSLTPLIRASSHSTTITPSISGGTVTAYQWYVNGTAVPGAGGTASSLNLGTTNVGTGSPTTYSDLAAGNYYVQLMVTINGQNYLVPSSSVVGDQIYIKVNP